MYCKTRAPPAAPAVVFSRGPAAPEFPGCRRSPDDRGGQGEERAITKPYKFIGFGAIAITKPYKFIGFGAIAITKPYKYIGFGAIAITKPYKFIGFGAHVGPLSSFRKRGCNIRGVFGRWLLLRAGPKTSPQRGAPPFWGGWFWQRFDVAAFWQLFEIDL